MVLLLVLARTEEGGRGVRSHRGPNTSEVSATSNQSGGKTRRIKAKSDSAASFRLLRCKSRRGWGGVKVLLGPLMLNYPLSDSVVLANAKRREG